MMKLTSAMPADHFRKIIVTALLATLFLFVILVPEMAFAADADVETEMNTGLKYVKFFFEMFLWGVLGLTFLFAALWIISAISDWRSNEKNGTIGNIVVTVVISLMAVGIVAVLVAKGLTIVEDNIKDTVAYQIEPPTESPTLISYDGILVIA